ncbi:glycosyltransferase family 4 protein [Modestobacter sp. NPDC049651]|uniref:glycosyltransferase family 4 protein n=1 Tax=unclassified Modestobacter TaxID=2643866 RepID=UPI0033FBBCA4
MTPPSLVVGGSYGAGAASMRVRVLQWLRFLDLGAEVHDYLGTSNVRPATLLRRPLDVLGAEVELARFSSRARPERLLISRSMGPFTRGRAEAALLTRAGRGVYDFDDALFDDRRGGVHGFFGEATAWERSVRAADVVLAGNDHLASAAARLNPNVEVLPTCVEPSDYPLKQQYAVGSVPRLVWLGSPVNERYVVAVAPALLEVHRRTGARLTMISAGDRRLGALDAMTDRVQWAGARTDALLAESDVGIMPLPDTPYERGKCAYKLLQYAAAGLPAVATPIGVNAVVVDQVRGLAARDHDEWVQALVTLLEESGDARRVRGRAARAAVEQHYSYRAWQHLFCAALALPATSPVPPAATPPPGQLPAQPAAPA